MLKQILANVLYVSILISGPCLAKYPEKPIQVIVPAGAGGGSDMLARLLAEKMFVKLGQPVIVENRPGASGTIGSRQLAVSKPDGYTILVASNQHSSSTVLMDLPYDGAKDIIPIVGIASMPMILEVNAKSSLNSIADLIALAKEKPGSATFASAGIGNTSQLGGEELSARSATQMLHIPYKGAGPATADLLGNHVTFAFNNPFSTLSLIRDGQLKALAVSSLDRMNVLPDVPTVAESGYPGFEVTAWFGVLAPAGTPTDIVNKLNAVLNEIMELPDVKKRFGEMGIETIGGPPEKFGKMIKNEMAMWKRLVQDGRIQRIGGKVAGG